MVKFVKQKCKGMPNEEVQEISEAEDDGDNAEKFQAKEQEDERTRQTSDDTEIVKLAGEKEPQAREVEQGMEQEQAEKTCQKCLILQRMIRRQELFCIVLGCKGVALGFGVYGDAFLFVRLV